MGGVMRWVGSQDGQGIPDIWGPFLQHLTETFKASSAHLTKLSPSEGNTGAWQGADTPRATL